MHPNNQKRKKIKVFKMFFLYSCYTWQTLSNLLFGLISTDFPKQTIMSEIQTIPLKIKQIPGHYRQVKYSLKPTFCGGWSSSLGGGTLTECFKKVVVS